MTIKRIVQAIKDYETIIIHRHVRPDPDALGSQAGLREIIKQTFPDKSVYIVGEEDPSLYFLARMDQISDKTYEQALVIVCDTANTVRISDTRYTLGDKLIKIDHHPNVDQYGDLRWVDTDASSTSEMIYDFYLHAQEECFILNDEAARLIYAGIVGDTGRFMFPNTTKKTFQFAADLVVYDFDRTDLYTNLYRVKDNIARLKGFILQQFHLSSSGMSSVKLTREILEEYNVNPMESSALVGTLGDIEGIKAWAIFIEEEKLIRVRLRSKGPVINDLAAKYNGGGHPMASGASVDSWGKADQVIQDLEQICQQYRN